MAHCRPPDSFMVSSGDISNTPALHQTRNIEQLHLKSCGQWMVNAQVLIQHFSALPEQQLAIL